MKKLIFILLSFFILTSGLVAPNDTDDEVVNKAISLQQQVINDTLFEKILTELESSSSIEWSDNRTSQIKEKLSDYKSNVDWLLSKYKDKGGFCKDSVFLWKPFKRWSRTTASTSTCAGETKLNKRKLDRDEYSILNTLIHERTHSFCLNHGKDQTRPTNQCDAAYIAGDLAEILISNKMGIKEITMDKPMCPALLKKVKEYNLIIIK